MFQRILEDVGFKMKTNEFEKLWYKYDSNNNGAIEVQKLIDILSGQSHVNQSRLTDRSGNQSDRQQCINIERWLTKKFREGIRDMYYAFREFDTDETVTREQFLMILHDYGLLLEPDKLDAFLERCTVCLISYHFSLLLLFLLLISFISLYYYCTYCCSYFSDKFNLIIIISGIQLDNKNNNHHKLKH